MLKMGEIIITTITIINSSLYKALAGARYCAKAALCRRPTEDLSRLVLQWSPFCRWEHQGLKRMIDFTSKLRCWYVKARADRLIRKSNETQHSEVLGKIQQKYKGVSGPAFPPGCHPASHPRLHAGCCISVSNFPAVGAYARFSQTSSGLECTKGTT